jgi:hypothetical protein
MRKPFPAAALSATSLIEGVYTLEEFKRDGEIFRPPQATGRWVVLNGAVIFILNVRTQASKQTNVVGIGHYTVSETTYSYQYDEFEVFTETDGGITVSRKLPWEGMRPYTAEGDRLQNAETRTDFICSADGVTYNFGQGNYRKYRRIKSA